MPCFHVLVAAAAAGGVLLLLLLLPLLLLIAVTARVTLAKRGVGPQDAPLVDQEHTVLAIRRHRARPATAPPQAQSLSFTTNILSSILNVHIYRHTCGINPSRAAHEHPAVDGAQHVNPLDMTLQ